MTTITPTMPATADRAVANFPSLVSGELFKIRHNRGNWVTGLIAALVLALNGFRYLAEFGSIQSRLVTPSQIIYQMSQDALADVRGYVGIYLTVLTVIVVALEYQQGTVRILLARGVGRMRLLTAKLVAIFLMGLFALIPALLVASGMVLLDLKLNDHLDVLSQLPDYFWMDGGVYLLTILVSMVATILLATTISVIGRTLAVGLSLALPYFLVEGVISGILLIVSFTTTNQRWYGVVDYFLGGNLTRLPTLVFAAHLNIIQTTINSGGAAFLPRLTSGIDHVAIVIAAYCLAFIAISYYLTWKRDVNQ